MMYGLLRISLDHDAGAAVRLSSIEVLLQRGQHRRAEQLHHAQHLRLELRVERLGGVRLVAVVHDLERQLATADAAGRVDVVDPELVAGVDGGAQVLEHPAGVAHDPERDRRVGHALVGLHPARAGATRSRRCRPCSRRPPARGCWPGHRPAPPPVVAYAEESSSFLSGSERSPPLAGATAGSAARDEAPADGGGATGFEQHDEDDGGAVDERGQHDGAQAAELRVGEPAELVGAEQEELLQAVDEDARRSPRRAPSRARR